MIPVSPLGLRPLAPHGQSYCLAGSSTPRTPVACRSSLARLWDQRVFSEGQEAAWASK